MKKEIFLVTMLLGMALLFGGCGVGSGDQNGEKPEKAQGAKQTLEDDQVKLYCIEMTVESSNDAMYIRQNILFTIFMWIKRIIGVIWLVCKTNHPRLFPGRILMYSPNM